MAFVPLNSIADQSFVPPKHFGFAQELGHVPLTLSEMHLSSFYFALAVRYRGEFPELCALLHEGYLSRSLAGPQGEWLGGYVPLAIRAHPFRLVNAATTGDPMNDLEAETPSPSLVPGGGVPLLENGKPSAALSQIYGMLNALREARRTLLPHLDRLFMADLMVPLPAPDGGGDSGFFIVDRARFVRLSPRALMAMARQDFHAVEIATACTFSQRLLKREVLGEQPAAAAGTGDATPAAPRDFAPSWSGLDQLPAVLDEDELFSFDDVGVFDIRIDERP
jgi:hypothetical protein